MKLVEVPFEIPDGWEWVNIGQIAKKIGSGSTPKGGNSVYIENGVKFIRSQNVHNSALVLDNIVHIPTEIHSAKLNSAVYSKDVLLNITGASIGRSCLVPDNFDVANLNQHVMIIRLIDEELRYFLHTTLISNYIQLKIQDVQVGTSREGLSREKLVGFNVPLPPLNEQTKIKEKVETLFNLLNTIEQEQKALQDLSNQLKQKVLTVAMQGKLVPQDPNDEPASVLLEKIRAEKQRLFEEGKLKKKDLEEIPVSKEDNAHYGNEKVNDDFTKLPRSWNILKLGQIVQINPRNVLNDDKEVSFIPMNLLNEGYGSGHTDEIKNWKSIKSGFTHFKENDVAFAKITPCFQNRKSTIFKNLKNGYGAGTTEIFVLRPFSSIIPEYLLGYIQSGKFILEGMQNFSGAVGQQRVPRPYLEGLPFPIPPIQEQKRIVDKIESTFKIIENISS